MERRIRLRRNGDVRRVFEEGESWAHPLLVLIIRRSSGDTSRVGVTASRKVGGAVERNRAKRLLREAARHLYPEYEDKGWDIMLVARPKLIDAKTSQVERGLASLLERAGLRREESHASSEEGTA